ncbi:MAG TPA: hypothetical protein VH277_00715 [Gemmatimonadaceae bacterium]|jgi:hypothetical protein|nr:hypothetical protein [Gemmatimonadaceae bacterium]
MLRWIGRLLLALGGLVGVAVALAMLAGFHPAGVSWLVAIGMAKLGLVSAGGLMAAGAVLLRLDNRERERRTLQAQRERLSLPENSDG